VIFSPKSAGPRNGAVQIVDGSGNVLATTYIHGIGVGPQVTFANTTSSADLPNAQSTLGGGFSGLDTPWGTAVDGNGNVFVADFGALAVYEFVAASGYTNVLTLGTGSRRPVGVAVDGSGNVFFAAPGAYDPGPEEGTPGAVYEIVAAGGYTTLLTVGSGLNGIFDNNPYGVAVDGSGNVFVADSLNNSVYELLAGAGYTTVQLGSGFLGPQAVAVDSSGNVFVADTGNNAVKEILAAGGYTSVLNLGSGFNQPYGVTVEANGNVLVADAGNNAVKEIVAAGGYTTTMTVGSGFGYPIGVAVDASGNLFVADTTPRLTKLDFANPPSLNFAATIVGSTSSDSPQSVAIQNIGNATLSALAPGLLIGNNFKQVAGSGTPVDCTARFSLAPGVSCNLSLSFTPTTSGTLNSTATLTNNALNSNPATQSIALTGIGIALSQTITFAPLVTRSQGTPLTLSGSATSGLAVSFTSLTPSVCSVSGTTVALLTPGTCTIQALQPGNPQYAAAAPVDQSFTVTPAATFTITPTPTSEIAYRNRLGAQTAISNGL
jgi:sugar lactone lactonase YvrE